jgi:uncharacterized protein (TIGR02246 family)
MVPYRIPLLITPLLVAACSAAPSSNAEDAELRQILTEALNEHGRAAEAQDVEAAAILFAEDARVMLPGIPDVHGRDSVASLMATAWPAATPRQVHFNTEEVYPAGDMAVSVGTYEFVIEPTGQAPVRDIGRFMLLWARDTDGQWRVFRDLTNSELAAPVPVEP